MKKLFTTLAAVMFVAVMSMGFGSCGNTEKGGKKDKKENSDKEENIDKKEKKSTEDKIVGTWLATGEWKNGHCEMYDLDDDESEYLILEKDGNAIAKVVDNGYVDKYESKWRVDDEILTLYDEYNGESEKFKILKLNSKELEIKEIDRDKSYIFEKR